MKADLHSVFSGRGRRNRTLNQWFWRPLLYQLSYTPTKISGFLSSQGASPQVLSAFAGLTAVFGMGTGGSPQLSPLNYVFSGVGQVRRKRFTQFCVSSPTPSKLVLCLSYPDNCIKMFFLTGRPRGDPYQSVGTSRCLRIVVISVCPFPDSQFLEIRVRFAHVCASPFGSFKHGSLLKSSPRSISTGPLRTSLYFHSRPINHIVFVGPYLLNNEKPHL